jgi:Holliday junction resolvasome RuvABC endonuclease subunit
MGGLANLSKTKASRVMGIDASTNFIAFTIFYNRAPVHWGKITLEGGNIYQKIGDANAKIYALYKQYDIDYIAVESAVFVKSPKVAIDLAYVFGAILGVLVSLGVEVITVPPTTWQFHIGNKLLTKAEKDIIKSDYPGKSASWYQNKGRELRKQRTMDFFNKKWPMNLTDNDVGDATGIAYYAYYQLTRRS